MALLFIHSSARGITLSNWGIRRGPMLTRAAFTLITDNYCKLTYIQWCPYRLVAKIKHQCRPPMQAANAAWRMLKKEEQVNSSCAPASTPCSQSRQTCSFVLGFIPLIGEPGCPLSGLVHARCSQGHGWYDSLALTDFLPGQGWSLGQLWGDGFECQWQPGSDSRTLTHLTGNCALVVLFFPPNQTAACCTLL